MAKSLQQIEDYYLTQGLKGEELRIALENDVEFQKLLKERKAEIRNKFNISEEEEKEYLLPNQEDYEILATIKSLEDENLSDHDKEIIDLMKTQLKAEWRKPLIETLQTLMQKYSQK
jgi:hypothetical protein